MSVGGRRDAPFGAEDAAWRPEAAASTPTIELPGYTDFEVIARGGDAVVYRAQQTVVGRQVAVKVLRVDDPETQARFRRELELTVRLGRQHPNIVTVLDTGRVSTGEPCIVMELHDLGSLHDRLEQLGPLPVSEVVAAGTVVADALAFAHDQGVLHRDVKPQNVLLLPTSYVLADFGIARPEDAGHTASAERFSYRHASPQVLDGHAPSAADDLWSLGSTLFTLLDGRPPFASLDPHDDTALAYLRRVRTERPRELRRDDVPVELAEVVARLLAPTREGRFPDAAAVRDALAQVPTEARRWAPPADGGTAAPPPHEGATSTSAEDGTTTPEAERRSAAIGAGGDAPDAGRAEGPDGDADGPDGDPGGSGVDPRATSPPTASPPATSHPPASRPAVAASALAHPTSHDATGAPDEDATLGHPLPTAPDEPSPEPVQAERRVDRRVWAFAAVALLLSAGLSIAIAFAGREPPPQSTTPPPGGTTIPEFEGELPDEPAQPTLADDALTPTLELVDDGTTIRLSWSDPTDGAAPFVVLRTVPEGDTSTQRQFNAGTTDAVLEGLDPDEPRYCFRVVVIAGTDRQGVSDEQCATRDP